VADEDNVAVTKKKKNKKKTVAVIRKTHQKNLKRRLIKAQSFEMIYVAPSV